MSQDLAADRAALRRTLRERKLDCGAIENPLASQCSVKQRFTYEAQVALNDLLRLQ
jgi:hypothetical protein